MKQLYLLMIILVLFPVSILAWNSTGHIIITAIAYDQMETELQYAVRDILREHPEYELWMEEIPEDFNEGAYLMMRSGLWPDEIRRTNNKFDHPNWHYVNFFLLKEEGRIDTTREDPENDIIWGIDRSTEMMKTGNQIEKAVYLSWINHQPMHCTSLVSSEFPEGDRGGNRSWVKNNGDAIKLHFYWDMLPGKIAGFENAEEAVIQLTKYFPNMDFPEIISSEKAYDWAMESINIAYKNVYQEFELLYADNPEDAVPLTEEYHNMAQEIYKRRIMLAAYRLQNLLELILNR